MKRLLKIFHFFSQTMLPKITNYSILLKKNQQFIKSNILFASLKKVKNLRIKDFTFFTPNNYPFQNFHYWNTTPTMTARYRETRVQVSNTILENVRSVHTWQPSRGIMLRRLWRTSLSPAFPSLLVFLISGTSAQQCARVHTTGSTRGARVCHVCSRCIPWTSPFPPAST